MISFKQLQYALAVEKTLHFKRAAEQCHVSQSALSTALSELENQLNVQIFERDNKKVLVTPIGKDVLQRARRIVSEVGELQQLSDNQQAPLSYPLTLGLIPTIAPYLLPTFFPALYSEFPAAQINIVEEQSAVLVEMVRSGEIDAAILALPYPCDGLLTFDFHEEDFYWITSESQEIEGQASQSKMQVTSEDLENESLLLLKEGHCLKDHILDACKLSSKESDHRLDATSLHTLVQMVKAKLGTTLIPKMALPQLIEGQSQLTALHLDEPSPHRTLAFVIRPNYTRMASIEALSEVCKQALES